MIEILNRQPIETGLKLVEELKLRQAQEDLQKTNSSGALEVQYWAGPAPGTKDHPESPAQEGAVKKNLVMLLAAVLMSLLGACGAVGPPVEHAAVERRECLAREQQLVDRGVGRAAKIEHAFDEAIVVEVAAAGIVVAGAEVEQKIAVGLVVAPSFVRHQSEHERAQPGLRLAVAYVDHAAVVELLAAAAVRIPPAVESARDGERETPAGVEQAAIVLA